MASALQCAKIGMVFGAMDVDSDGFLTEEDFRVLTWRWARTSGQTSARRLSALLTGWWNALCAASDPVHDGRVSLAEVLLVVEQLGERPGVVRAPAEEMFSAIDADGDGRISRVQYGRLIEAWCGAAPDVDEVFPRLDRDGDGHLSAAEFSAHWTEFWAGDDPAAPGTWLFGRIAVPVA
ncbi:EF-hand domain-containing protein [Amycolatopsis ultiminotia]|uniref:EF-hand domain-containing protein n=1 Tax=Amycolatopsis ultiminotia TaxID=543629 RepID=A0ABP6YEA7_9PSEU